MNAPHHDPLYWGIQGLGFAGGAIILYAFWLNSSDRIDKISFQYHLMNLIGSFLLLITTYYLNAWGAMLLNTGWCCISIAGLRQARHR